MKKIASLIFLSSLVLIGGCAPPQDTQTIEGPIEQPPLTPTGLRISSTTVTTITVAWNMVSTAESYCLYRDVIAAGTFTDSIYSGNLLSFIDTSLTENSWYYYKIQAINDNGFSPKSSTIGGKTQVNTDPPPIPQNIVIADITSTSMTINWDTSQGATSYQLYKATATPAIFTEVYSGPDNIYINNSLTSGQTYYYRVRAVRETYYSDYSNTVSARTLGKPLAPAITSVGDATITSLRITWSAVDDADGYRLYQAAFDDEFNLMYSVIYDGTNTEFLSTGLHIGWKYFYMVSAYNAYGEGIRSSKVFSSTLDGLESLNTTYNSSENHTYFDADTRAYKDGTGTAIFTEIYDEDNNYLGSDFTMIFIGTSPGIYSGGGTLINYGFSDIQSTSCTINVTGYGNIGERITGTFSAVLEDGKTLTGNFTIIRGPDQ